ncbi:MAG: HD domain-containing protein [Candidatus Altiarchaeales archaeon]|nr:MAG: HD domain-containing protein [Candidatus Altiarchaeales archaeon]
MTSKTIRDPIHGNISVSELELSLIDTAEMQRLRNIRQNGLCYLIYPAMNSTRFEHSLGVMHLAGILAERLGLNEQDKIKVRIAGLLHDIGHCALSHTSDSILKSMGHSHEENSVRIVMDSEISDILKDNGINPADISELIQGKGKFGNIISSEIDVDKMDYLIRDSYYAGVAYGVIDLERIIHGMMLMKNELVIKKGSLEAVESLLISRNLMYQTVYRHHTKRIVEEMMKRAIATLIENGDITYEEFIRMDDIDLIHKLRTSDGYPRDIMSRIDRRDLFKIIFQERLELIDENFRKNLAIDKDKIEEKIREDFGIENGYLLLDIPDTKLSEFRIKVEFDNELKRIDEVSSLARALEKAEMEKLTICIYTSRENIKKFKDFNPERYIELSQTRLNKFISVR